jgi:epothilone synthetase B
MLEAYRRLLLSLIEDDRPWRQPCLELTPPEQLAQRVRINATEQPFEDADQTLYQLFLTQAIRQPDARALVSEERRLSYSELRQLASRLGSRLRELGAEPEKVVAICLRKGWEQVVAVLGIHACGAAYLPIDAEMPLARISFLLENSQAVAILTQADLAEQLPAKAPPTVLMDGEWQTRPIEDAKHDLYVGQPEQLSHVIYTSGSTGQPKGVMVEHRQVVNRLLDINQRYGVGPQDKALALTALHHDLSVYDLYGLLMAGGEIVIPKEDWLKDPAHWIERLTRHQVTLWNSVPAFLEMLIDYQEEHPNEAPALPSSLRFVILAGDWIPVSLPERVRRQRPNITFIASGGPTETTIWDIYYEVNTVNPSWRSIPYGRPLANSRYYVLNHALHACPSYVPGELYIAGAGVTRGYLGDPERTAEKYIQHPQTGERLYRSGDLGRYLPDGNIEFLGRRDFQVKIRGQRIELAEIEVAAKQYPNVRQAIASVCDEPRGKSLLLHVVPQSHRVTACDVCLSEVAESTLEDEEQDFLRDGLEISDPAQRLQFKMEHRTLRDDSGTSPVALLPPQKISHEHWRSWREYEQEPIPLADFSRMLGLLCARTGEKAHEGSLKFNFGSAGGLYPVQTYVCAKPGRVETLESGLYYYNPVDHHLTHISDTQVSEELHYAHNRAMVSASAFSLFFIGDLDAIVPLYGEVGRLACFLEAGSMAQLLRTYAPDFEIGLCQIGHFRFDKVEAGFRLRPNQILLASLVGGAVRVEDAEHELLKPAAFKEALTQVLSERLPPHMVPSRILLLDSLPVNANGKVDRSALPQPDHKASATNGEAASPANDLEATIATVWQELLEMDAVDVERNFFDLGANSALVVKAYHRIRERLQREFPLITLFRYPTTRSLAAQLSDPQTGSEERAESGARAAKRRKLSRQVRKKNTPGTQTPNDQDR